MLLLATLAGMKTNALRTLIALGFASGACATPAMQNVYARTGITLDGKWHVIVDPYENGAYNYRREPLDAAPNPTSGYFLDHKAADRSELVEYEVTGRLRPGGNSLVVKVDNTRHADAVPTVNTDWWNYGGITRDVTLVEEDASFVEDYTIQLKKGNA